MRRHLDWLRQAEADLAASEDSIRCGHYEWACFQAQQSAEKSAKAILEHRGIIQWGHSVLQLLSFMQNVDPELTAAAKVLDRYYIPTRYPNGFPAGAPVDYYDEIVAREAYEYAKKICESARAEIT